MFRFQEYPRLKRSTKHVTLFSVSQSSSKRSFFIFHCYSNVLENIRIENSLFVVCFFKLNFYSSILKNTGIDYLLNFYVTSFKLYVLRRHQSHDIMISHHNHKNHEENEAESVDRTRHLGLNRPADNRFNNHKKESSAVQRRNWN